MSCPMIVVTGDGTAFGCAAMSLTENGMAVLDEGGSRLGFVPYDSLNYVAPAGDQETGSAMTVRTTDGSEFSCASLSQTGAGVATLNPSGGRVGFVPYEMLQHILPAEKTGASLPSECSPPAGVAGNLQTEAERTDPAEDEQDTDDGAEHDDSTEEAEDAADGEDDDGSDGGVWSDDEDEDADDEDDEGDDSDVTPGGDESGEEEDEEADELWEDAEESTDPVDPTAPVVEEAEQTEDEAASEAESGTSAEANADTEPEAEATTDETNEEAGESEMKVEWSFGEYDE